MIQKQKIQLEIEREALKKEDSNEAKAKVEDISKIEKNILCFACVIMKSLLYLHCNQKHKTEWTKKS